MLIGVIPARSNSKRIKSKNIKKFNGKPIIAWTIEAAKKANIFEKIIVSTDSKKSPTLQSVMEQMYHLYAPLIYLMIILQLVM